jgi:hypothetical protein
MYLVVLMNSHIARTWMLFLYALSPNESVADVLNQVSNILFSKLCGFFIAATIIVRGWKWVFHISWFSYALRALANNDLVRDGGVQRACTPTPEVECRFQNGAEALELYYVSHVTEYTPPFAYFVSFASHSAPSFHFHPLVRMCAVFRKWTRPSMFGTTCWLFCISPWRSTSVPP